MNEVEFDKDIRAAVLYSRYRWDDVRSDMQEEITQEIWYEVLSSPAMRRTLTDAPRSERRNMLKKTAVVTFAKIARADSIADNSDDSLVSVEIVKDTLKGNPPAPHFARLVEVALLELSMRDNPYSEALRRRYRDGVIPSTEQERNQQKFAHIALTDEANTVLRQMHSPPEDYYDKEGAFPTLQDGPKLGNSVEPGTRKATGGHSDPTGEAAVALVMNPAGRELFYQETPLAEVLAGKGYA